MALRKDAVAALVFLVLYFILFMILIFWHVTKRIKFMSRWLTVTFHVLIRLAAQATGIAFGVLGYKAVGVLVAYFVLGAEGYFSLVLCTYRFLISWQSHNLPNGSWLEPKQPKDAPLRERFLAAFALDSNSRNKTNPLSSFNVMVWIHYSLIAANTIIVVGGSQMAGDGSSTEDFGKGPKAQTGKSMRVAGQAIFLAICSGLLFCVGYSMKQSRTIGLMDEGKNVTGVASSSTSAGARGPIHPTLYLLLAAWPFLCVRGVYGILASCYDPFSYYNPDNYTKDGLKDTYIISEYILGTTMEWISCVLLMATWYTSRNDKKTRDMARTIELEEAATKPPSEEILLGGQTEKRIGNGQSS